MVLLVGYEVDKNATSPTICLYFIIKTLFCQAFFRYLEKNLSRTVSKFLFETLVCA